MAAHQLKKLAPSHKAMAQWLIANPLAPRTVMAQVFQISPAWLSSIINSDAFKHYLRKLDEDIAEQILLPIRGRLAGVADVALEKLGIAVGLSNDPKFLLDAADKTLHRLGYAPNRGPAVAPSTVNVQQNNVYVADGDALRRARERMHEFALPSAPEGCAGQALIEHDSESEPEPSEPLPVYGQVDAFPSPEDLPEGQS